jgi:hypothetical protein
MSTVAGIDFFGYYMLPAVRDKIETATSGNRYFFGSPSIAA